MVAVPMTDRFGDEPLLPDLLAALLEAVPAGTVVTTLADGRPNRVAHVGSRGVEATSAQGGTPQPAPSASVSELPGPTNSVGLPVAQGP